MKNRKRNVGILKTGVPSVVIKKLAFLLHIVAQHILQQASNRKLTFINKKC